VPAEEIVKATQTAHGYLVSPISDHVSETPEGFLVVVGCPVCRTGFQQYTCRDLPQESARELGVDMSNPSASIDLYRDEADVFEPEFLASLNGKPIVDGHPSDWVNPDTFSKYAMGHLQNPRRAEEPLEDGNWPVIADLVISGEPLVSKIRNHQSRDISLGYDYGIKREGEKILQVDMRANHVACVPSGRAGDLVSIGDQADATTISTEGAVTESPPPRAAPPEPAASPPEPRAAGQPVTLNAVQPKKEKPKVKNNLLHIFGLGLKAKAADAETSPEELAEMASDVGKIKDVDPDLFEETQDKKGRDKKRAKDAPVIEETPQDVEAGDSRRKAMHDALDKLYDGMDKRGKDVDIEELKGLLDQYLGEEAGEAAHQAADLETDLPAVEDADPAELEELLGGGEEPDAEDTEAEPGEAVQPSGEESLEDEEDLSPEDEGAFDCAHCGMAHDLEACPSCGCTDKRAHAKDRARAADGVAATLRMLRPFVARCNDSGVKRAYNTALGTLTRKSRASSGSYGAFAAGARQRARDVGNDPNPNRNRAADASQPDRNQKMQAYYDQARVAGGK
jgi:hypothetical protein